MLSYFLTVARQLVIMTLLMALGYILYRRGMLSDSTSRQLSALLMRIVTPAVLLTAFARGFDPTLAKELGAAFLLAIVVYGLPILFSRLVWRGSPERRREKALCTVFSNNGFMAIPLLQALLGSTGVFLGAAHIVAGNTLQWTYAARMLGGKEYRFDLRNLAANPGIIGLVGGMALFFLPVQLPGVVESTLGYLSDLNTPLAMLVLGVYLAQADLKRSMRDASLQLLSFVKLVALPLALIGLFKLLPVSQVTATAMLIGSVAPTGMTAPMMCQYFKQEHRYCALAVALSSLYCIVTIPLLLTLLQLVW